MAITNVSSKDRVGFAPGAPVFLDVVELDLDDSYPNPAGYANFSDTIESVIGKGRTILGVFQVNQPAAWICRYNPATDALHVYTEALAEAANGANLATMADVQLLVVSK